MTPTREQLAAAAFVAENGKLDHLLRCAENVVGLAHAAKRWHRTHETTPTLYLEHAWEAYFALGEALRQTGTEPPQPAEET